MFGPKPTKVLIFKKTKLWWENLKKIHLPEERKKLSRDELIQLAKENQILAAEIRHIQLLKQEPLESFIDFKKLLAAFFREYKYKYGVPIENNTKK